MNKFQTWYVHWYYEDLIWIVNGQILSIFDSYLPATDPYFHFRMITLVNINRFSPNLVCALILWRSALGILIGKFRQFLTSYLPGTRLYFYFWKITSPNINGVSPNSVCALILWTSALRLLMVEFRLYFWQSYLPATHLYFTFRTITWVNLSGFSPNLICALRLWRSALGLLIGKFCQFLTVISPWHDNGGVLSFHVLIVKGLTQFFSLP